MSARVARVLPDVTGLDKEFDYSIPDALAGRVEVGTIVRVALHGRRVGGWVVDIADDPAAALDRTALKPIAKVTGLGPDRRLIDLAAWAAVRWAARGRRPFLVSASPHRAVTARPDPDRTAHVPGPASPATAALLRAGGGVLRLPPRADPLPSLLAAASHGPTLAVVPSHEGATLLALRLRRAGVRVALVPDEWARALAGVDVVIGSRVAAWAPCADMAAAVLLDEHDEALQEERSPTWHARDVMIERCRRADVPLVVVSPIPTVTALAAWDADEPVHPPAARERAGWPTVRVVDRSGDEPWRRSLVTSELVELIRDHDRRVACVSNITGRARLLACRACRALIRCEYCDAAVGMTADGTLDCGRCGTSRPPVCQECGASRFANLRPGVTRLREELQAAAARPAVAVTGDDRDPPPEAGLYVGTEAVLHRIGPVDAVAFLEFDSELLAPRFHAAEQALALIVRAGRLAPDVLVQTFSPDHEVLRAAVAGDPGIVARSERERRRLLGLPPYGALALVTGSDADDWIASLGDPDESGVVIGGDAGRVLVRAPSWEVLGAALRRPPRPDGRRLRIEVDPPRV